MKNFVYHDYMIQIDQALENLEDDVLFANVINNSSILGLSDEQLSVQMQMSLPTIKRWKQRETTPFPVMRRGIYMWLKTELSKKNNKPLDK